MVGETNNTANERMRIASEVILFCNKLELVPPDKFVKEFKFGGDVSRNPMHPMSAVMLDQDVLCIMKSAYPGTSLSDLMPFASVMEVYWQDVETGKEVIHNDLRMTFE